MMNMVNTSTGYLPFQLQMGQSPRIIPPLMSEHQANVLQVYPDAGAVMMLVDKLNLDTKEAQDNLLAAKFAQAEFTNRHRGPEPKFKEGDHVMLSTKHQQCEYMQAKSGCVSKLMLRFDGPFLTMQAHPEKSNYTLHLPNEPKHFPTFHTSQLQSFVPNNNNLFPSRKLPQPGPVVTSEGQQEWLIDRIINQYP